MNRSKVPYAELSSVFELVRSPSLVKSNLTDSLPTLKFLQPSTPQQKPTSGKQAMQTGRGFRRQAKNKHRETVENRCAGEPCASIAGALVQALCWCTHAVGCRSFKAVQALRTASESRSSTASWLLPRPGAMSLSGGTSRLTVAKS